MRTENGQINLNHGLVTVKDPQDSSDEIAYLFDADPLISLALEARGAGSVRLRLPYIFPYRVFEKPIEQEKAHSV